MSVPDSMTSEFESLVSNSQVPETSPTTIVTTTSPPVIKKSNRTTKVPSYLQDYVHPLHA